MSSSKQRKARRDADRREWEHNQAQLVQRHRRRRYLRLLLAGAAVIAVVAVVVTLLIGAEPDPAPSANGDSDLLASEAAADAQGEAVAAAMAAGEVVADDFTVRPGTAVDSGEQPAQDDRPVACGGTTPANATTSRPRYPGGPAQVLKDGVDYVAVIETSCGPIRIDLLERDAPVAVNSFVFLASEGFYDGLEVFRDFGGIAAAQAGSGNNTVNWDVGYRLPDELALADREGYPIGTVTTASEGAYTAGSEFFIAYGKQFDQGFETDRRQTIIGRVLSGMNVIERMTAMDRTKMGEAYAERLFMETVRIEKR